MTRRVSPEGDQISLLLDLQLQPLVVQIKFGILPPVAFEVDGLQAHGIPLGRCDGQLLDGTVHTALVSAVWHHKQIQLPPVRRQPYLADLLTVIGGIAGLHKPFTEIKFHNFFLTLVSDCRYVKQDDMPDGQKNQVQFRIYSPPQSRPPTWKPSCAVLS